MLGLNLVRVSSVPIQWCEECQGRWLGCCFLSFPWVAAVAMGMTAQELVEGVGGSAV